MTGRSVAVTSQIEPKQHVGMFFDWAPTLVSSSALCRTLRSSLVTNRQPSSSYQSEVATFSYKHFILLLCIYFSLFINCVSCGSVAVYGNRGTGHTGKVSENWGVLSEGTQIFLLVLGGILALFALYGFYRLIRWCRLEPRKI